MRNFSYFFTKIAKSIVKRLIFDGKIITVKKDRAELENGEVVTRELVAKSIVKRRKSIYNKNVYLKLY